MEAEENGASLAPAVVSLDNMDDVVTSACGNCSKVRCCSSVIPGLRRIVELMSIF